MYPQALIVRHAVARNGRLFHETYVSYEKVEGSGGLYWTELMINAVRNEFDFEKSDMRQIFGGASADGQYIKCNLSDHLATVLELPPQLTKDATTWDYSHD